MNEVSHLPARHRPDVDAYYRMAEMGILGENPRVELIDGDVIDTAPIGGGHAGMVNRLAEALFSACMGRAILQVQNPVRLDRFNEPEPDFAVLRRREEAGGAAGAGGDAGDRGGFEGGAGVSTAL